MTTTHYFPWERLSGAARDLCLASGSPQAEADLVSTRLLRANLTGHDSHGIIRLAMYMEWMREGWINPGRTPEIEKDGGATCLINGNRGYGQVAADYAMTVAIERAQAHGIAGVGVTNQGHIGRLADYVIRAAQANMVGLVFTSTGGKSSLVAPGGGKSRRMSTNPIAAAFPSDREQPIVFDMATSVYAEGKFRVMRDAGAASPENMLLDKEGRPSTDPEDLYDGGAILPAGGYKGYLLNFMVEALGGLITGGGYMGRDEDPLFNNCSMMIVIDVARYRDLPGFKEDLEGFVAYLKASPALPGQEVLHPGEVEARREAERLRTGVPLADKTVQDLQAELDRHGVDINLLELTQQAPTPVAG